MSNKYATIAKKPELNRPVKTGGYSSDKLHAKRDRKRREAEQRQREYDALSLKAKVSRAFQSPGASTKEFARLRKYYGKVNVDEVLRMAK